MRPSPLLMIFVVILVFLSAGCGKDKIYTRTFKGSVGYSRCNVILIDIEGETGTGGGVVWTEPSGKVHLNAVTVNNFCYIANTLKDKNITGSFTFRISKENRTGEEDCPQFFCLASGPSAEVFVYDINN